MNSVKSITKTRGVEELHNDDEYHINVHFSKEI